VRTAGNVFSIVCLALIVAVVSTSGAKADDVIRIGTYDNRGVAIAYARSQYLPVMDAHAAYDKAEAAGDTARMNEISGEMEALQRQLHRQGFGRVPVDDLLEPVAHRLPDLAADLELDAIVWICDFAGENVEIVDVTMDLVQLYDPSPETLEICGQIGDHEPVDLDDLDHDH